MPRYERIANDGLAALDGAINDSVTSMAVDDGSVFPSDGDFRVKIGNEVILAHGRSGNTLSPLVRGVDGTAAASHSDTDEVRVLATAGQWDKVLDDLLAGASANPPHRILDANGDALAAAGFSWTGQGTATLSDTPYGGLTLTVPGDTGTDMRLAHISTPSAPWIFTGHVAFGPGYTTASSDFAGFVIRESSSANIYTWRLTPGGVQAIQRFTSPTSGATNHYVEDFTDVRCWLQIEDDGVDLFFRHSYDGTKWHEVFTHSRTTHFTTGPDQIGVYGNAGGGNDWHIHYTAFMFE